MSGVVRLSSQNHWPNVPICWLLTKSAIARRKRLLKASSVIGDEDWVDTVLCRTKQFIEVARCIIKVSRHDPMSDHLLRKGEKLIEPFLLEARETILDSHDQTWPLAINLATCAIAG